MIIECPVHGKQKVRRDRFKQFFWVLDCISWRKLEVIKYLLFNKII
jgi:hypothetical protein